MYGFAPVFYVTYVILLSVNALSALFYVLMFVLFWPFRLLPGRIECWRMHFVCEDIVCFVQCISLYGIFRVCPKWTEYTGIVY